MQSRRRCVKGNHRWKHNDIMMCFSSQKSLIKTQVHLLYCEPLLGQNENITYIPEYKQLYTGYIKDKFYVSSLLKENFDRRIQEAWQNACRPMWTLEFSLCSAVYSFGIHIYIQDSVSESESETLKNLNLVFCKTFCIFEMWYEKMDPCLLWKIKS